MTNETRQDGCAEWCGLPYKDERVPYNPNRQGQRADGSSLPWGISDRDGAEQTDPAYCTAACLERAQEKPTFVPYAKLPDGLRAPGQLDYVTSRPNVSEWTYLAADVAFCFSCDERARYVKSTGPSTSMFACAACKEKPVKREPVAPLVFGPVAPARKEWPRPTTPCHRCGGGPWQTVNAEGDWCVSCWEKRDKPAPLVEVPTCAGPLATHGTPVLRVMGPRDRWGSQRSSKRWLCDGCYMIEEAWFEIRTEINDEPDDDEQAESTEPPARIGTVPQVVSVGVGIWASRGMR